MTIVQETTGHVVRDGWIWQQVYVQVKPGRTELWEFPVCRRGASK